MRIDEDDSIIIIGMFIFSRPSVGFINSFIGRSLACMMTANESDDDGEDSDYSEGGRRHDDYHFLIFRDSCV